MPSSNGSHSNQNYCEYERRNICYREKAVPIITGRNGRRFWTSETYMGRMRKAMPERLTFLHGSWCGCLAWCRSCRSLRSLLLLLVCLLVICMVVLQRALNSTEHHHNSSRQLASLSVSPLHGRPRNGPLSSEAEKGLLKSFVSPAIVDKISTYVSSRQKDSPNRKPSISSQASFSAEDFAITNKMAAQFDEYWIGMLGGKDPFVRERQSLNNDNNDVNDWQRVPTTTKQDDDDKFFVYSAWYDNRVPPGRLIRIIGALRTKNTDEVYCRFWFNSTSASAHRMQPSSHYSLAIKKIIRENWNLKYSAYFILCVPSPEAPVPEAVSVFIQNHVDTIKERAASAESLTSRLADSLRQMFHISSNSSALSDLPPTTFLPVLNNMKLSADERMDAIGRIAVCVKPFHYNFDRSLNLIEFIELNRLVGANHFVFYNHTTGPNVDRVLKSYITDGIVTLLPWHRLDIASQQEIRTEGLFSSLNDCLYRTMGRFQFTAMIDLDEVIIPHATPDLTTLFRYILSGTSGGGHRFSAATSGGFSFRNAFFYLIWPDDPLARRFQSNSTQFSPIDLVTLAKTTRKTRLHPHKQRSKCVVMADAVVEMGNHFVWQFTGGKSMLNVDERLAFVHHYRNCEFGGEGCIKTPFTQDRRVHLWKDQLIQRVSSRMDKVNGISN